MIELDKAIDQLVVAANLQVGREPAESLKDALNALAVCESPGAAVRVRCAECLSAIESPAGIGFVAVWLGGSVENGAEPDPNIPHLLTSFRALAARVVFDPTSELEQEPPDEALAIGLEFLGQALVAHIARSPRWRLDLCEDSDLLGELVRLDGVTWGASWLLGLLSQHSDDLVVLHATKHVGFLVRYENVMNCFHLFSLIQSALGERMPGGRSPSPLSMAIACGELREVADDEAWWHYGQPTCPKPELLESVFGEGSPQEIGVVNDSRVLLVWPPILAGRTWDSGFFSPILEASLPSITVKDQLSSADVEAWYDAIGLDATTHQPSRPSAQTSKPSPRWQFWKGSR